MYVLGTAGHVDHGKSALVQALTGIDPDRLPEEKRREMTIDLGFAWLKLPSGREVSIIDVPGHERFIKNMLAGVGGIDLAILVIAADEGVMPQTREHLAILDLLNVKNGIVVITKKDLVDEEELEIAKMEAEELIRGTALEGVPILTVSAKTGEGLPELIAAIDRQLDFTPRRRDIGRPRLPIDRAFTVRGFGTVVTGTLIDGQLRVGQEVEILPPGLRAHIRGLETHKRRIEAAVPGSRVAANLAGVQVDELERGMVVTNPGWLKPTQLVDVRLRAIKELPRPIAHNMTVTFHTGASETVARVLLLDKEKLEGGEIGWAQLRLSEPVAVARGDPFIIRSASGTLGGGEIVDAHPRRHRRFQEAVIKSLEMKGGDPKNALLAMLEDRGPSELGEAAVECHFSEEEARRALEDLIREGKAVAVGSEGPHQLIFPQSAWRRLVEQVEDIVASYHSRFPLRRRMPKEELKSRLKISPSHADEVLRKLVEEGILVEDGAGVRLPSHQIKLSPEQQAEASAFLQALEEKPYAPPKLPIDPELLNFLVEEGKVVKVSEDIIFSAAAYEEMVRRIIEHLKTYGKITVAEVRDMFQTSRKYAVALMEYLDEKRITRRIGNERVLRA